MSKKTLGILLIILIAIGIFIWYSFITRRKSSLPNPSRIPTTTTNVNAPVIEIPELPKFSGNYTWRNITDDLSRHSSLEVLDIYDPQRDHFQPLKLPGETYFVEVKGIKTFDELDRIEKEIDAFNYYQTKFEEMDWSGWGIDYEGKRITAITADGGGSSLLGRLKQEGEFIRVVSIFSKTTYSGGEFPIDPICPCDWEIQVFVSDVIPLSKIVLEEETNQEKLESSK